MNLYLDDASPPPRPAGEERPNSVAEEVVEQDGGSVFFFEAGFGFAAMPGGGLAGGDGDIEVASAGR